MINQYLYLLELIRAQNVKETKKRDKEIKKYIRFGLKRYTQVKFL